MTNAPIAGEVECILRLLRQSCVWTSARGYGVVMTMDDVTADLFAQLCTQAGIIMEDASVIALTVAGMVQDERRAALAELHAAAERISAMVEAARALLV